MYESILIAAMIRIDEDRVLSLAKNMFEKGISSMRIIEEARIGVSRVREMYEEGKYFLSDLIMSAEIFSEVAGFLKINENHILKYNNSSPVIVGTVKNDIHDIGKNIMIQLLQFHGFNVIDMGVDVPPGDFVQTAVETSSRVLFMSGLLTLSYESMKSTVREFEKNNLRNKIKIVIGGLVDERVREYVQADYWAKDSNIGINLCQNILCHEEVLIS